MESAVHKQGSTKNEHQNLAQARLQRILEALQHQGKAVQQRSQRLMRLLNDANTRRSSAIESATASKLREAKAKYIEHIELMVPAWTDEKENLRMQKYRKLEDKRREIDHRRQVASQAYERDRNAATALALKRHEVEVAEAEWRHRAYTEQLKSSEFQHSVSEMDRAIAEAEARARRTAFENHSQWRKEYSSQAAPVAAAVGSMVGSSQYYPPSSFQGGYAPPPVLPPFAGHYPSNQGYRDGSRDTAATHEIGSPSYAPTAHARDPHSYPPPPLPTSSGPSGAAPSQPHSPVPAVTAAASSTALPLHTTPYGQPAASTALSPAPPPVPSTTAAPSMPPVVTAAPASPVHPPAAQPHSPRSSPIPSSAAPAAAVSSPPTTQTSPIAQPSSLQPSSPRTSPRAASPAPAQPSPAQASPRPTSTPDSASPQSPRQRSVASPPPRETSPSPEPRRMPAESKPAVQQPRYDPSEFGVDELSEEEDLSSNLFGSSIMGPTILSLGRKKGGGNKLGGGTGSTFAMAGRKGPSAKPKQKLSSLPIFSTVARGGGGGDLDELDEFDF